MEILKLVVHSSTRWQDCACDLNTEMTKLYVIYCQGWGKPLFTSSHSLHSEIECQICDNHLIRILTH